VGHNTVRYRLDVDRMRELLLEGFTYEELAIMFQTTKYRIKKATWGLKKPERI